MVLGLLTMGGLVYVGATLYKKHRQQKRLSHLLQPASAPKQTIGPQALRQNRVRSFRQEFFQPGQWARFMQGPLAANTTTETTETESALIEQQFNHYLAISIASFGFALGGLVYAPLNLISVLGNLYIFIPRFRNAYQALWTETKVNIDTLVVFVIPLALLEQYYVIVSLGSALYALGGKMVAVVKRDAQTSLVDIFRQHPRFIWVRKEGVEVKIKVETLEVGDIVVVQAGEVIPIDGVIVEGLASVDQQVLTGEAQPIEKGVGDQVFAATLALKGRLYIEAAKAGSETIAAQIGQMLNQTISPQSTYQLRAETLSNQTAWYTFIIGSLALPFIGVLGTLSVFDAHFGYRLLVISPLTFLTFFRVMAQSGILVKDGRIFDLLSQVDTLVFDKTGTLTQRQPQVGWIYSYKHYTKTDILAYAAAAEARQSHPIALALRQEAARRGLVLPETEGTDYKVGYGLTVTIDEQLVRVGSSRFLIVEGLIIPPAIQETIAEGQRQGHSMVLVAVDDRLVGVIELRPSVRPEAKEVIQGLRKRHINSVYIISGDHETPTRKLAEELAVDHYYAETLPQHKAEIIAQLQAEGKVVCYIGDGINDAIALKQAQVSISLAGASTAAIDTAQLVFMDESLEPLCRLFDLNRELEQNLRRSTAFIFIPFLGGVVGSLLLLVGLQGTLLLKTIAFGAATANAILPLVKHRPAEAKPGSLRQAS